jgi:hypothetical protein
VRREIADRKYEEKLRIDETFAIRVREEERK